MRAGLWTAAACLNVSTLTGSQLNRGFSYFSAVCVYNCLVKGLPGHASNLRLPKSTQQPFEGRALYKLLWPWLRSRLCLLPELFGMPVLLYTEPFPLPDAENPVFVSARSLYGLYLKGNCQLLYLVEPRPSPSSGCRVFCRRMSIMWLLRASACMNQNANTTKYRSIIWISNAREEFSTPDQHKNLRSKGGMQLPHSNLFTKDW